MREYQASEKRHCEEAIVIENNTLVSLRSNHLRGSSASLAIRSERLPSNTPKTIIGKESKIKIN
jgi:hypothetical protein